jgi:hypothetical protein
METYCKDTSVQYIAQLIKTHKLAASRTRSYDEAGVTSGRMCASSHYQRSDAPLSHMSGSRKNLAAKLRHFSPQTVT